MNRIVPPTASKETSLDSTRELKIICQQLLSLLSGDRNAEKFVSENSTLLSQAFPADFTNLRDAINQFDNDRALDILRRAMGDMTPLESIELQKAQMPVVLHASEILMLIPELPVVSKTTMPAQRMDAGSLEDISSQLIALLANDQNAERLVRDHAELLRNAYPAHFFELQTAISHFDGERGLAILLDAIDVARRGDTNV